MSGIHEEINIEAEIKKTKTKRTEDETYDLLRSIVKRIERLEEEKKELSEDISSIFKEAKSAGLDASVIREVIKERRKEPSEIEEHLSLLDVYRRALEMV